MALKQFFYLIIEAELTPELTNILKDFKKELEMLIYSFRAKYPSWKTYIAFSEAVAKAREPRLYWFPRPKGEKDILIFDAGYEYGDVHVYEQKETLPANELENQIRKYGYHQHWRLV